MERYESVAHVVTTEVISQADYLVEALMDSCGDPIQEVRTPFAGVVVSVIATPPIGEGELMVMMGEIR